MNKVAEVDIGQSFGVRIGQDVPLGKLVSNLLTTVFVVVGIIFIFFAIFSGISLISSADENSPEKIQKAQRALTTAIIGIVIVFTSYFILRLLEVIIGVEFITNPNF